MKKYILDNIHELLCDIQDCNRKLREFANKEAFAIDRALLRHELLCDIQDCNRKLREFANKEASAKKD